MGPWNNIPAETWRQTPFTRLRDEVRLDDVCLLGERPAGWLCPGFGRKVCFVDQQPADKAWR